MFKDFKIENGSDIPIYQQITDMVRGKVLSGELAPGAKMPTVRELSVEIGVAQGTVKRAYDELESLGIVEKAQGKGTFISKASAAGIPSESRKDRAMVAIDNMFDELESMGFSSMEINIFLELKQLEREARHKKLKVALVECNPEVMHYLVEQIRTPELDIYPYLLEDIRYYPYKIEKDTDLIITTATHYDDLLSLIPLKEKIMRVALSLTTSSVHDMLMIPQKSKVGIISQSDRFGQMLKVEIKKYDLKVEVSDPIKFDELETNEQKPKGTKLASKESESKTGTATGSSERNVSLKTWTDSKDYILLPEGYEKFCTPSLLEVLDEAKKKGKIITCIYKMDRGSEIQVEERIKTTRNSG